MTVCFKTLEMQIAFPVRRSSINHQLISHKTLRKIYSYPASVSDSRSNNIAFGFTLSLSVLVGGNVHKLLFGTRFNVLIGNLILCSCVSS